MSDPNEGSSDSRKREEDDETNEENVEDAEGFADNVARLPSNQRPSRKQKKKKRRRRHVKANGASGSSHARAAAYGEHHQEAAEYMVEQFQAILSGDGDENNKARNALEATAGNIALAAQLYWDDHFASQAGYNGGAAFAANQGNHQPDQKMPAGEKSHDSEDSDEDEDDDNFYDVSDRHPHRKIRRSLDQAFRRTANEEPEEEDEEMADQEREEDNNHDHPAQHQQADAMEDDPDRQRIEMGGESVSVSDDETRFVGWGIVGRTVTGINNDTGSKFARKNRRNNDELQRRIREAAAAVAKKVSPKSEVVDDKCERKRKKEFLKNKVKDDDDDDYISDSDWLQDDWVSTRSPSIAIWGKLSDAEPSPAEETESAAEGNVVADEDTEDRSKADTGIPLTWLNASFSLSSCSTAMALKPPKPEDIEFFTWRQQQNQERSSRTLAPPPFHCKAITGVLSVVNAMLLTGSTIQGEEVNCTSAKKPFGSLTATERKNQFDTRLAEAIAALIHIAANASMKRKMRAFEKMTESEDKDEVKLQRMQRRLHLVPTCTWLDDFTASMSQVPDGPSHKNVQIGSSLTNIHDIRSYVQSNIRKFTAPGGVALLLETIFQIHGAGVISRMLKQPTTAESNDSLICCTCEARQKAILEKTPISQRMKNNSDPAKMADTTPPGHACISVELMSLLVTGKIRKSWNTWATEGLGFGILSDSPGKVGWQLARPLKPVWVLQGETCYTVLWLDDCKGADLKTISRLDKPGVVMEIIHWNCWYGQQNRSSIRLITAAGKWEPPGLSFTPSANIWEGCRGPMEAKRTVDLLHERRGEKLTNSLSAKEHEAQEAKENEAPITQGILEATKAHPDDMRFYPEKFKMWRFDMGEDEKENIGDDGGKGNGDDWIPYHRLSARQKMIVEMKLGPKINRILWGRWPHSKIEIFSDSHPIV